MKRQIKFLTEINTKKKYSKKELTRFFFKANNFIFVQKQESFTKLVNRCLITGSPRTLKYFLLSRQTFRFFVNRGLLGGIRKSSW